MSRPLSTPRNQHGRICTRCGKWKPWDCFYPQPRSKSGYRSECKQCTDYRLKRDADDWRAVVTPRGPAPLGVAPCHERLHWTYRMEMGI